MSALTDYLERDQVAFIVYVTMSGVPFVFSHVDQPSDWTSIDGKTWDRSFVAFRNPGQAEQASLNTISANQEFTQGTTISGSIQVEFKFDPQNPDSTWLVLMAPDGSVSQPRDFYFMAQDEYVFPSKGFVDVYDASGLTEDDLLYGSSNETMEVTRVVNNRVYVNRGKYESIPQWYGRQTPNDVTGVTLFRSWPSTWKGRTISIVRAACSIDADGNRVPIASTYDIDEDLNQEIFRGIIGDHEIGPGEPVVRFMAQSIEQALERPVLTRSRTSKLGPSAANGSLGWIYVEPDGASLIQVDAGSGWRSFVSGGIEPSAIIDLTRTGGVFDGGRLVSAYELIEGIVKELNAYFRFSTSEYPRYEFKAHYPMVLNGAVDPEDLPEVVELERKFGIMARLRTLESGTGPDDEHFLPGPVVLRYATASHPDRSVLPALGVTSDLIIEPYTSDYFENIEDNPGSWSYGETDDELPHYTLMPGSTRLYYDPSDISWTGEDNNDNPGSTILERKMDNPPKWQGSYNNYGELDHVAVRIGKHEIVRAQFRDETDEHNLFFDETYPDYVYAKLKARGVTPPQATVNPIVVHPDDVDKKENQLVLGLLFDNHNLFRSILQMAISNGDPLTGNGEPDSAFTMDSQYNVLATGFGAGLPDTWFDVDSFERLQRQRGSKASGWWIESKTSLRELFGMVGTALGVTFLSTTNSDGRYQIGVHETTPPPVGATPDAAIDASWLDSANQPMVVDYNEREIINRVQFEFGYDPMERKYVSVDDKYRDVESIANYGPSHMLSLKVPWLHSLAELEADVGTAISELFNVIAWPRIQYEIPYMTARGWALLLNDVVSLTAPEQIDWLNGGKGISAELMQVVGKSEVFGPSAVNAGVLKLAWRPSHVYRPYAPTARIKRLVSGTTYEICQDLSDGGFSDPASGLRDVHAFAERENDSVNWRLIVLVPGATHAQTKQLTGVDVDANTLTVNTAPTLASGFELQDHVFTLNEYNLIRTGNDGQRNFAHICDADGGYVVTDYDSNTRDGDRWY